MDNRSIAEALYELADLLEIARSPAYQQRAFRTAARAIESLPRPASELLAEGQLTDVQGIGPGTARRVEELERTGTLAELERLRQNAPRGMVELLRVDGISPRAADLLWRERQIDSVDALEAAAREGRLRDLPRFSDKREQKILRAIEAYRRRRAQLRLGKALAVAEGLLADVRRIPGVQHVELAGALRRRSALIDGIDLVAAAEDPRAALDAFCHLPQVRALLDASARRMPDGGFPGATVRLRDELPVELHVAPPHAFGLALARFTGTPAHLDALAAHARAHGLSLEAAPDGAEIPDEPALFRRLSLPYIEPELREGAGELEAARAGKLPSLIEARDLRGDLHMHTTETDGHASLDEMVETARSNGLEYVAITDHSQALAFTRGLDPARLAAQGRAIAALNERLGGRPRVLRGIEADILPDGSMDLGPEILRGLDWVIGSVHSQFGLSREEQTRRVVRALESGVVDVLGHPTGRILGHRDPYPIDLEEVLEACRRVGAAVELNAFPDRLDLDGEHLRLARELGVPVVISTDSHATRHLGHTRDAIFTARRGWLEADDVVNTRPVEELLSRFAPHHDR